MKRRELKRSEVKRGEVKRREQKGIPLPLEKYLLLQHYSFALHNSLGEYNVRRWEGGVKRGGEERR